MHAQVETGVGPQGKTTAPEVSFFFLKGQGEMPLECVLCVCCQIFMSVFAMLRAETLFLVHPSP